MQLRDWDSFPRDLLSRVLSLLPPASLASATSVCSHWRLAAAAAAADRNVPDKARDRPPWLFAIPARPRPALFNHCFARDPEQGRWYTLSLDFLPSHFRPLRLFAPASPFLLCRLPGATLRLSLCNPLTRQLIPLPDLNVHRANPALGVVVRNTDAGASSTSTTSVPHLSRFRLYVAGGTSTATASYESTIEAYDHDPDGEKPRTGRWEVVGTMPPEFAVRLTVWTAGEGVHAAGGIYWVTSARAFSVVRFDVEAGLWYEIRAPVAESLEWASLVAVKGRRLGLIGGMQGDEEEGRQGRVWEMIDDGDWRLVGVVPVVKEWRKDGRRGGGGGGTCRCVGCDGVVYLFRDLCSGMLVWRELQAPTIATSGDDGDEEENKANRYARWKWEWVDGWRPPRSSSPAGNATASPGFGDGVAIRAALVYPSLSPCHIT